MGWKVDKMSDKYVQNVITLKRIKNVATDIKNDFYEGNDSHSRAEYKGACESLDMLIRHFEEVIYGKEWKVKQRKYHDWVYMADDSMNKVLKTIVVALHVYGFWVVLQAIWEKYIWT